MKYPAYPKVKDSGVPWLGDVPEHWDLKRGRFCMAVNPASPLLRTLDPEDEISFVPMDAVGEYGGLRLDQERAIEEVGSGYTEFQNGDVVVAKITPCFENGKGALASELKNSAAYGTTELHVLRALANLNRNFLFYLTISDNFRKIGESEMYGAGGQKRVPPEYCKDFRTPLPPLPEQTAIANFLDRETGRIDALIEKKRKLIALLEEKRSALISRTVTRCLPADVAKAYGLELHTNFKDSGVEWLKEIPHEWGAWKFAHACSHILDGTHFSPQNSPDGDYLYITAKNIKEWGVDLSNVSYISEADHAAIYSRCPVKRGDVLYIKDGATAGIATVNTLTEEFSLLSSVALIRPQISILESRYLAYQMNTTDFKKYALNSLVGGAMTRFTLEIISKFQLILPPLIEQTAIADFLDRETARLDQLKAKIDAAIERLQEYRAALITAAVTGKIDVRQAA